MIKKVPFLTLLIGIVGIMFVSIIGCGSDEEKPDVDKVSEQIPVLSEEDLLGTWTVLSINGLTPDEFFESPEGEDFEEEKVETQQFTFVFSAEAWTMNIAFEGFLTSPEEGLPDVSMEFEGVWSGAYRIIDPRIFFTTKEAEVKIPSDLPDFFEEEGLTKEDLEEQSIENIKEYILEPFRNPTVGLEGNRLTLIAPAGKKMVLEKQSI